MTIQIQAKTPLLILHPHSDLLPQHLAAHIQTGRHSSQQLL